MNNTLLIVFAFLGGLLLGIFFFYGLWLTVRKSLSSKIPALWIFGSFIIRSAIVLTGFYFIASHNGFRLLVCLSGFIAARILAKQFNFNIDNNVIINKTNHGTES